MKISILVKIREQIQLKFERGVTCQNINFQLSDKSHGNTILMTYHM